MNNLNINQIVKGNLCIGCGLCTIDKATNGMQYNSKNDCYTPINTIIDDSSLANQICPGKGYKIKAESDSLYAKDTSYDIELGYTHSIVAARTEETCILQNASSGGAITAILIYLLENKIVDKVSVTQFHCNKEGVHTVTFLTSDKNEILKAQGSKYCPVNLDNLMQELHNTTEKVAIMATPCAIAGIRNIEKASPNFIKAKIVFHITNFCGGFKSFKNIRRLAQIHKMDIHQLKDFRFRGGGQPGSLRFIDNNDKTAFTPYPLYVGLNGYNKMLRCHLCPDATGELADISCGDAWIPRFKKDTLPWSIIICRTPEGTALVQEMKDSQNLAIESVTPEEVEYSQRLNLTSKKKRQMSRMKLYQKLKYVIPIFDGGYYQEYTSMKTEWKVFLKHKIKFSIEKMGLYMQLYGKKKLKRNL